MELSHEMHAGTSQDIVISVRLVGVNVVVFSLWFVVFVGGFSFNGDALVFQIL